MKWLAIALLLPACCGGQAVVRGPRLRNVAALFDAKPGETTLRCDVNPTRPLLNYSFRYQAGYRVLLPANQFEGPGHRLIALTRVTPRVEGAVPVYFIAGQSLPAIPKTKAELASGGSYLLGEGSYDVAWLIIDERNRVCRKSWHVEVHRSRSERNVQVAMPEHAVWDVSLRGMRQMPAPKNTDDAAAVRLTILLNAEPLFQRRMRLRGSDVGILISAVTSLLERLPTRNVRLVVFNLEQQKEIYRNTNFMLERMPDVAAAMNAIDLTTVDYKILQNRRGHVDLLADMVNHELEADPPSDLVLVIGPTSKFLDRMPANLLEQPSGPAPRFVNVQIIPLMLTPSTLPDLIHNAVARLGGKTVPVHSPGEFAKVIARLEKSSGR
jgi:hypothetical protein